MKTTKILLIVTAILFLGSCKKDLFEVPATKTTKATTVDQLKVAQNFNWKTSQTVNLSIKGLNTMAPIQRTLIVTSADSKEIYYKSSQLMSETKNLTLVVPSTATEVLVTYGTIAKKATISAAKANFSYTAAN